MLNTNLLAACICKTRLISFNEYFLKLFLVLAVASVAYFFYWNRLLGLLITLGVRAFYWNQGRSAIWVELGAYFIIFLLSIPVD